MNPGELNKRIEVWGKEVFKNELKETDYRPKKLKTIWCKIVPQTGSLQKQQTETKLSNTTHKVIVRYNAGKDIEQDMYLMFKGRRFDIKFILNPYEANEKLEIFCEELIE
ncbi:SPP1 family predicted phage head-tail adaptor [Anaerosolibacter carboniphilus]|uniref:SPP1 family predicted phage head-tail adaptor n=1 Tax=Anaerosolibacter carboniphilus TaxID=1417629 RepID=A0A841KXW0_9FIRM|nr:phage head closure protein [Anaerosolibacter carboniphilus]MBB6218187.1 SPP1 family predicted phage head-tail adaptor [Anaerosolibacter carboniphilus]